MKPLKEMTIAMASDHAGFGLKSMILLYLEREGAKVIDYGCHSLENCDFPDFAHPMATAVEKGECDMGIGLCYTGNGMSMCANTHPGVRATVCWNTQMAENDRRYFDANVLCIPAGTTAPENAMDIIYTFFTTDFADNERYKRRIQHLANPNKY
jgi:ribose 5-phosphate isomerase B